MEVGIGVFSPWSATLERGATPLSSSNRPVSVYYYKNFVKYIYFY